MEEASFAAVNGELSPFTSGVTACRMIGACRDLTDYRRASEWIEATEKYCDRQSLAGFPGVCRIHRAEVAAVGGAWERAELELERATGELGAYNATPPQADGFYAIGDIRRLRGDFEGAEAALREAHARGRSPQPALALIRLAEGKVKAAATRDQRRGRRGNVGSLGAGPAAARPRWRSRSPPATSTGARTAVDELAAIVVGYPSPALEAGRQVGAGAGPRGGGRCVGRRRRAARPRSRAGATSGRRTRWPERGRSCPGRCGRSRTRTTPTSSSRPPSMSSAGSGARVDVEAAERELRDAEDRRSGPVTTRKTFMFTDIVGSTNLAEAIGDQAWERLLRWHDDMLRSLVASGGGEIVNSTGDGFFAAFDVGSRRRRLRDLDPAGPAGPRAEHRLRACRSGSASTPPKPTGAGPTTAAWACTSPPGSPRSRRGGEILATAETLAEAGDVPTSDARMAPVKGVDRPGEPRGDRLDLAPY